LPKQGLKERWKNPGEIPVPRYFIPLREYSTQFILFELQEYFTEPPWHLRKTEDVRKNYLVCTKINVLGFSNQR